MSLGESNIYLQTLPVELLEIIGHYVLPQRGIKCLEDLKAHEAALSSLESLASFSDVEKLLEKDVLWLEGECNYWKALEKVRFWTCLPNGMDAVQKEFAKDTSVEAIAGLLGPWINENLENLEELELSGNCVPFLPDEVQEFKNLKKLNLSGCMLEELTEKVADLENIKELDITHNKFIDVPTALRNIEELEIIEDPLLPERVFHFSPPKR
ncbi:MAG: Leucine-rich repeat (LRR) protein [Chlamydiales bacterium]|jgi:Leucine-rich repeat (LRR) protein